LIDYKQLINSASACRSGVGLLSLNQDILEYKPHKQQREQWQSRYYSRLPVICWGHQTNTFTRWPHGWHQSIRSSRVYMALEWPVGLEIWRLSCLRPQFIKFNVNICSVSK